MDKREDWPISGINIAVTMIEMLDSVGRLLGSASGFFFRDEDREYLVTNRHVVIDELEGFYPYFLKIRTHNSKSEYSSNNTILLQLYNEGKTYMV